MPSDPCPGCKRERLQCVCRFWPPKRALFVALLLSSCAAFPSSQGGECSETSLGLIVAECKLKVDRECAGFGDLEKCPAVHECDARVDAWEKCK